jgi:hypothetical protein
MAILRRGTAGVLVLLIFTCCVSLRPLAEAGGTLNARRPARGVDAGPPERIETKRLQNAGLALGGVRGEGRHRPRRALLQEPPLQPEVSALKPESCTLRYGS